MLKMRLSSTVLICALLFSPGTFCTADAQETGAKKIAASFYPVYIPLINITRGVPGISVYNLTLSHTGCLHDYALTAADMKLLAGTDIMVVNGMGMESFLEGITRRYPKISIENISKDIPVIYNADGKTVNPHVWVSISGAISQCSNLVDVLARLDPERSALYKDNGRQYIDKLNKLRTRMHDELKPYEGKKIVTFHEAFPYFAREFGFNIIAVIEREPGSAPSAKELARTIDLIKKEDVKVLFVEPQYPKNVAETIARQTGAKVLMLDPAVTGPDDPYAYIAIMEKNLEVLKEAFRV